MWRGCCISKSQRRTKDPQLDVSKEVCRWSVDCFRQLLSHIQGVTIQVTCTACVEWSNLFRPEVQPTIPLHICGVFHILRSREQKRHINIWHINNFSVTPVTDPPGRVPDPPGRVPGRNCLCSLGSAHST